MKPGAVGFLRFFYWALRRGQAGHLASVLWGVATNTARLAVALRSSQARRSAVAIAMMEHMGDVVAAQPIAALARRRFPNARIVWITRRAYVSIAEAFAEVDHVVSVTCLTEWMLLQRMGLFEVTWDLHFDGRMCPLCCIPQSKPAVPVNLANYFESGNLLTVQCRSAGLPGLTTAPLITPPPVSVVAADRLGLPPRFIVIHCVSSDQAKDWPADRWRALIERCLGVYSGAVIEIGNRPFAIGQDTARRRSLCGKLTILETAEVIRRAELFIGIDSGPAHLANAVATPGVILLGAYRNFRRYMPYSGSYATGEGAAIVRSDTPAADICVDAVFAAVIDRLAKGVSGPTT